MVMSIRMEFQRRFWTFATSCLSSLRMHQLTPLHSKGVLSTMSWAPTPKIREKPAIRINYIYIYIIIYAIPDDGQRLYMTHVKTRWTGPTDPSCRFRGWPILSGQQGPLRQDLRRLGASLGWERGDAGHQRNCLVVWKVDGDSDGISWWISWWSVGIPPTRSDWCFGTWIWFFHSYWKRHHPNWRSHIFQRGRYTTNQKTIPEIQQTWNHGNNVGKNIGKNVGN